MSHRLPALCLSCIHFREDGLDCVAFPEGIPDRILNFAGNHTEKSPDQVGDVVFQDDGKNRENLQDWSDGVNR